MSGSAVPANDSSGSSGIATPQTQIPQWALALSHGSRPNGWRLRSGSTTMRSDPLSAPAMQGIPAAQYVRMSTEHQQYSTANQADTNTEYAARNGFVIVRTYADDGKSGLKIAGRIALQQLIADVQNGDPGFRAILVYDVSRWGRFQDADESAYYEFLCRRAGIEVHYCAEQFENDGGPTATIMKSIKRAMAGEYSRELSSKVFAAQCRLIQLGYRQGGKAGYGLRRMLIGPDGVPKALLTLGERKALKTDRVILVPGPEDELRVVRRIYHDFTSAGKCERQIAAELNSQGLCGDLGRKWTQQSVHEVLTNEKYIGNNISNRKSFKLRKKLVRNPPNLWVRAHNVFKPIVSSAMFHQAQEVLRERNLSDDEMIGRLKLLIGRHLVISSSLIDATADMPSSAQYRWRFGSLIRAYQLAGYDHDRDYDYVEINRKLRGLWSKLVEELTERLRRHGAAVSQDPRTGFLMINGEFTAKVSLSRCRRTPTGSPRWLARINERMPPDVTILVCMDAEIERPLGYYLLPIIDLMKARSLLGGDRNGVQWDTYRFDTLDFLTGMASRRKIEVVV
jgi:DNA invertase Pin-like site-specific DNA recombinase